MSSAISLRQSKLGIVNHFINSVKVLPFNVLIAKRVASIYKEVKRKGRLINFKDIFIAATAIIYNPSLLTSNKKHFQNMSELELFA